MPSSAEKFVTFTHVSLPNRWPVRLTDTTMLLTPKDVSTHATICTSVFIVGVFRESWRE